MPAPQLKTILRRTSSPKKPTTQPGPAMLPYRDENGEVKYAPAPDQTPTHPEDSDGELLIPIISRSDLDADGIQHFTATGRPMPAYRNDPLQSWGGDMYTLPQLLPKQYTDDSIIPAIVTDVIPSASTIAESESKGRRSSLVRLLKGERSERKGDGESKGITKVVFMPRREYQKWFARGDKGEYIGSKPYHQWTEEELDEMFKQYRPPKMEPKGKSSNLVAS